MFQFFISQLWQPMSPFAITKSSLLSRVSFRSFFCATLLCASESFFFSPTFNRDSAFCVWPFCTEPFRSDAKMQMNFEQFWCEAIHYNWKIILMCVSFASAPPVLCWFGTTTFFILISYTKQCISMSKIEGGREKCKFMEEFVWLGVWFELDWSSGLILICMRVSRLW